MDFASLSVEIHGLRYLFRGLASQAAVTIPREITIISTATKIRSGSNNFGSNRGWRSHPWRITNRGGPSLFQRLEPRSERIPKAHSRFPPYSRTTPSVPPQTSRPTSALNDPCVLKTQAQPIRRFSVLPSKPPKSKNRQNGG